MKHRIWKPAERYCKTMLLDLLERVKQNDADAIEEAVVFCLAESRGVWHGRARAKICRNLKTRDVETHFQDLLVDTICSRLITGNFSEQFKDQLTMAIRFRPQRMLDCATNCLDSKKSYVQRYAAWVLARIDSTLP